MNRLWVRLSLMISAILFLVFFLQFLQITLSDRPPQNSTGEASMEGHPDMSSKEEIASRLVDFMALSLVVGLGGGFLIGRVVSAPVTGLVQAAARIGAGNLDARVPLRGSLEMKELAQTFNKMAGDLQQAENLRKNLMADVSHELRTPLAVLEGNLRAALDKIYLLDEAEIANLYAQTRHLTRLVNDLRELSLAEFGQLPMEMTCGDLKILACETLQALEPLALEKEIELVCQVADLPETNFDAIRIRQVLFNLLTNALRHTPSGGQIKLSGKSEAHTIILSIEDDGEGLEPDQLESIFDRFYRVDKSRSRETGGTGLGLAIVKAIIETHGGKVEAHSAGKDKGCQFLILLPVTQNPG